MPEPTSSNSWEPEPTPLCYPIPFAWTGVGAPACSGGGATTSPSNPNSGGSGNGGTPSSSSSLNSIVSPYSQCGGSTADSSGNEVTWAAPAYPTQCACGYECESDIKSSGYYSACSPIPNFNQASCVGSGTQTGWGQCGGSTTNAKGKLQTWGGATACPAGFTCEASEDGYYAQCVQGSKMKVRRGNGIASRPKRMPQENLAAEPTPAAWFSGRYERAAVAAAPTL